MKNSIRINRALAAKTKQILFVAALALTFAACNTKNEAEDKSVATFEEAAISPQTTESTFKYSVDTTVYLESGNFKCQQIVDYGGTYVVGGVVSNQTTTDVKNGYADAYKSAKGGAYAGKNYLVWYADAWTPNAIKLASAAVVPGMYVCNTALVENMIKLGDGMSTIAGGFTDDDHLLLTITGSLEGKEVNGKVDFYLAQGKTIVTDWTYVDLSTLGKIDELHFAMSGTKSNNYGLTTPTYFCIDNLGAKK
jgi:hypothetical protein